jgi:hypothetical protein
MKKAFIQLLSLFVLAGCLAALTNAQTEQAKATTDGVKDPTPATAITASTTPIELARAALAAQGGDKYKSLKSMVLRGSVDLYAPNSTQSIPGGFVWVVAGEKLRLEIAAPPAISFKQIYDGERAYSSLPGVDLPPASKFGLPLLAKFDQPGYTVSALPDKKKQRGFRIADAEGNTTDFYVDPATGRVMSFMIPFNGALFGTENKKFKEVEGVLVPFSFTQRLEMPQGAFFAEYTVKEVKLNQALGDDVFALPN